jgi:hypothetical protein
MDERQTVAYKAGFKWGEAMAQRVLKSNINTPVRAILAESYDQKRTEIFNKFRQFMSRVSEDSKWDDFEDGEVDGVIYTTKRYEFRRGCVS